MYATDIASGYGNSEHAWHKLSMTKYMNTPKTTLIHNKPQCTLMSQRIIYLTCDALKVSHTMRTGSAVLNSNTTREKMARPAWAPLKHCTEPSTYHRCKQGNITSTVFTLIIGGLKINMHFQVYANIKFQPLRNYIWWIIIAVNYMYTNTAGHVKIHF